MSAIRRPENRTQARKAQSSPYARPQPLQRSKWSLSNIFEPIRRRVFGESSDSETIGRNHQISRSPSPSDARPPEEPSFCSVDTDQSSETEPPKSPSKSVSPKRPAPVEGRTPNATMENVLDWLTEATGSALKRDEVQTVVGLIHKSIPTERTVTSSLTQSLGRPLGAIEVEGMISLLRKQMPRASSEPFRFKTSTPSRDTTPTATTQAPRKMLTKNPNGPYRWQGAGSSKVPPRRNRYGSPAFGTSNVTAAKIKAASEASDATVADGKRRKVESASSSFFAPPATSSLPSATSNKNGLPFPISSSSNSRPTNNGTPSAPPSGPKITIPLAAPAPPRMRTPVFKPSLPSHPSPLRHAWTGSPDSSIEDISTGNLSPPRQPTQAASFMSELIEKVTPAKKPDALTNPYQTASPIAKVGPPRRSTRRTKPVRLPAPGASEKEKEEEKQEGEKTRDLPPEAIFAATLPKGSKRSRPPATLDKTTSHCSPSPVSTGDETQIQDYTVEEVEEDRANKKQKGLNGLASPPSRTSDIEVEEINDVEAAAKASQSASSLSIFGNGAGAVPNGVPPRPTFGGFKPTAVPSRPSKLRFSYQAEGSTPSSPSQADNEYTSKSPPMDLDTPPPPTLNETFTLSGFTSTALKTTERVPEPTPAPAPTSFPSVAIVPVSSDPKEQALSTTTQNLQIFTFAVPITSIPDQHLAAAEKAKSQSVSSLRNFDLTTVPPQGPSKPNEAPKVAAFDWGAAGLKAPVSTSSKWTCTVCGLQSPDGAKDCIVCEAPRPAPKVDAPKATRFNWAAAGMKPPSGASKWKCAMCDLENPEDVKVQCTVCETPRPGAKAEAPKPSTGFNWAAAGMKPPPVAPGDQWACSLCGLKNPTTVAQCTICDTPR